MPEDMLCHYNLKDQSLWEDNTSFYRFLVWQPEQIIIILGNSNTVEKSVFTQAVYEDKVSIVQRPSGGEAVILSPRMLVVSAVHNTEKPLPSKKYFHIYNTRIIHALENQGVHGLSQEGISDIAIYNRKIAGSAMYRNPKKVFFHAVINVSQPTDIIEKYLRYPQKTPAYRDQRNHRDFVTSLQEAGFPFSMEALIVSLSSEMKNYPGS